MITQTHAQRRGVALVLVLAFLVLISVFVIGFFVSASSELQASAGYAATATTQQLSETATNIVIGQIREATTRPGEVWASQPGMLRTFRTSQAKSFYKLYSAQKMVVEGTASGTGEATAQDYRAMDTDVPTGTQGWNHKPAIYVNLNDPVRVALPGSDSGTSGTLGKDYEYRYPIFDPSAFYLRDKDTDVGNFLTATATLEKRVEGAELVRVAADDSGNDQLGKDKLTVYSRMPVRWMYILKDGTVTTPDKDLNGTIAQWSDDAKNPGAIPSAANPIVGRVAFWTDDDTCKVNINTAGGYSTYKSSTSTKTEDNYPGSYWDTPRFFTTFDRGSINPSTGAILPKNNSLALAQPARNEFQRYPGHPSTTSLGLVFKDLLTSSQIYALTPRLTGGGSDGGSRRLIQAQGGDNKSLTIRHDRLYASVDEMLFAAPLPTDSLTVPRTLTSTQPATAPLTPITPELVNRMRFFLTAHSRAPELNIFGQPRVTIWPLWPIYIASGATYSTALNFSAGGGNSKYNRSDFQKLVNANPTEKLIAFCSTIGPRDSDTNVRPYFFQRTNPYSATEDANIPRNRKLFAYLSRLMGQPTLGAGGGADTDTPGSFKTKYPGEPDESGGDVTNGDYRQIIAEIFDYIRCVNLNDSSHDTPDPDQGEVPYLKTGASNPAYKYGTSFPEYKYSPHGYVVPSVGPSELNGAPGFGRFPSVSEAALVFYHAGYAYWGWKDGKVGTTRQVFVVANRKKFYEDHGVRDASGGFVLDPDDRPQTKPDDQNGGYLGSFMRAFVMFEGFSPMQGYSAEVGFDLVSEARARGLYFQHECTGLDGFTVKTDSMVNLKSHSGKTTGNLNFPPTEQNNYTKNRFWTGPWGGYYGGVTLGGAEGFFHTLLWCAGPNAPGTATSLAALALDQYYPFQSTPIFAWPTNDGTAAGYMINDSNDRVYIPTALKTMLGVFIPKKDKMFTFTGGTNVKLMISFSGTSSGTTNAAGTKVISTLELKFPDSGTNKWPVPTDNIWATTSGGFWHEDSTEGSMDMTKDGRTSERLTVAGQEDAFTLARRIAWTRDRSDSPWRVDLGGDGRNYGSRPSQLLQPGDTIRSLIPFNPNSKRADVTSKGMGDPRALALVGNTSSQKAKYLQPHPLYLTSQRHAQGLRNSYNTPYFVGRARDKDPYNIKNVGTDPGQDTSADNRDFETHFGVMLVDSSSKALRYQSGTVSVDLPYDVTRVYRSDGRDPDFDTGIAGTSDGGYLNKSDEGTASWRYWDQTNYVWVYYLPYYNTSSVGGYDTFFSPNKQMPSAVQFGSLLSGRTKHWQTLAFCPNPLGAAHPGTTIEPRDHFLLDFFTMPVVEPYAISEPFSTAGKVNLNFAMAPFGHIRRSTAMRAVLHAVRIVAVPNGDSLLYKQTASDTTLLTDENFRFRVNRDETLKGFQAFFDGKVTPFQEIFRTGSQICERFLYPNMLITETSTGTAKKELAKIGVDQPKFAIGESGIKKFWQQCILTGDNMREKPYNDIYPRITTKSNTYTVHMWVQALKKNSTVGMSKNQAADYQKSWSEGKDQVVAEYRGSTSIERYIDPEDRRFDPTNVETRTKNDAVDPDLTSIESLYRFRVVESKRFAP